MLLPLTALPNCPRLFYNQSMNERQEAEKNVIGEGNNADSPADLLTPNYESNAKYQNSIEFFRGQECALVYLIGVAGKTKGAEVWRALFSAELHHVWQKIQGLEVNSPGPELPLGV